MSASSIRNGTIYLQMRRRSEKNHKTSPSHRNKPLNIQSGTKQTRVSFCMKPIHIGFERLRQIAASNRDEKAMAITEIPESDRKDISDSTPKGIFKHLFVFWTRNRYMNQVSTFLFGRVQNDLGSPVFHIYL